MKQLSKFAIIGVIATLINNVIYHFVFVSFDVSSVYANMVGFLFAFSFSFIGSIYYTFSEEYSVSIHRRAIFFKFIYVAAIGFLINTFFAFILVDYFRLDHRMYILTNLFVTPCLTFCLNKIWVFRGVK